MAGVTSLNRGSLNINTGKESIVIKNLIESIEGGRSLDVTGFGPAVIIAGHVIIKETSSNTYKPMPLASADTVYGTLPTGHTYEGILIATVETSKAMAGILVRGTVNPNATPFAMTSILAAFKAAKPLIDWRAD